MNKQRPKRKKQNLLLNKIRLTTLRNVRRRMEGAAARHTSDSAKIRMLHQANDQRLKKTTIKMPKIKGKSKKRQKQAEQVKHRGQMERDLPMEVTAMMVQAPRRNQNQKTLKHSNSKSSSEWIKRPSGWEYFGK